MLVGKLQNKRLVGKTTERSKNTAATISAVSDIENAGLVIYME